jgi:uncharacterized membrane protein
VAVDLGGVLTAILYQVVPFLELVAALIILGGGVRALTVIARRRDAAQASQGTSSVTHCSKA